MLTVDHLVTDAGVVPMCLFEDYTDITKPAPAMVIVKPLFFSFLFLFMKNITFDNVSTNFLCYNFSGHQLLGLSIRHLFCNSVPKADKRKDHCSCLSCWMVTSAKNELL